MSGSRGARGRKLHIRGRTQRGMSLVVAIFLVVVIASLAAFAVRMGTAARNTTNLQLLADRALAAAKAGTEWGAYRALAQGLCTASSPVPMNAGAIRGFRVTVECLSMTMHAPGNYRVVDIRATAQWGNYGSPDYAYRQVVSRFSNAP
jgi:MSHA biogenesis protein MshP